MRAAARKLGGGGGTTLDARIDRARVRVRLLARSGGGDTPARHRVVHTRLGRDGGGRSPWSAVTRALGEWAWKTAPLARL